MAEAFLPRVQALWHAYQVGKSVIHCERLLPSCEDHRVVFTACEVAERLSVNLDYLTEHAASCNNSSDGASCPCAEVSESGKRPLWDDGFLGNSEALVARLVLRRACEKGKDTPDSQQPGGLDSSVSRVGLGICEGLLSVALDQKVSLEKDDELSDVLLGAPIHKVQLVCRGLLEIVVRLMDETTCFEVLSLGYRCQDARLYAVAWDYCMEHFDVAVAKGARALQSLPLTLLHSVLSSDVIHIQTELSIFEAMTCWVAGDTANRERFLPQLLQTVRLHLLSIDELSDHVESHALLQHNHACALVTARAVIERSTGCVKMSSRRRWRC